MAALDGRVLDLQRAIGAGFHERAPGKARPLQRRTIGIRWARSACANDAGLVNKKRTLAGGSRRGGLGGEGKGCDLAKIVKNAGGIVEGVAGASGRFLREEVVEQAGMIAASAGAKSGERRRKTNLGTLGGVRSERVAIRAKGANGGSFVGSHSCAEKIRDGDGGNDEDEGDGGDAEVTKDEARGGEALAFEAAGALADFGERKVSENDSDDGSGEQEKEESTDEAADGFAAGGRLEPWGKRFGVVGRAWQGHAHLGAALGAEACVVGDEFGAVGAVHGSGVTPRTRVTAR